MRCRLALHSRLFACALLCAVTGAHAQNEDIVMRAGQRTLSPAEIYHAPTRLPPPTHALRLTLAYFPDAGWSLEPITDAARSAAVILGQCHNLMLPDTSPVNTRLNAVQCARLRDTATANGLLQRLNHKP